MNHRATMEGTDRFSARHGHSRAKGFFNDAGTLTVPSLAIGTYMGEADEGTDRRYEEAIRASVIRGSNLIDTAVNYRHQRSERAVGRALSSLIEERSVRRDEIIVCTKGGFIPFDGSVPEDVGGYFRERFVNRGVLNAPSDVIAGTHCMAPSFLADQVGTSLSNLSLECIDVYYLHNPETQRAEMEPDAFEERILGAFETLEDQAEKGRIGCYGIATWSGLRVGPESPEHLNLERIVELARLAGGADHRFRFIQLPVNLGMLEGVSRATQRLEGREMAALDAAAALSLTAVGSATLSQGRFSRNIPALVSEKLPDLDTDAQRALHFIRSIPNLSVSLVGMSHADHVEENLSLRHIPPMSGDSIRDMMPS